MSFYCIECRLTRDDHLKVSRKRRGAPTCTYCMARTSAKIAKAKASVTICGKSTSLTGEHKARALTKLATKAYLAAVPGAYLNALMGI